KIKILKLHSLATLPTRGSKFSSGLDLYSVDDVIIKPGQREMIKTVSAVSIPYGFYGRIAPRSGLAVKHGLDILAGVIDSDYRGEILCILINLGKQDYKVTIGTRIAQLIVEKIAILDPEWS